VVLNAAFVERFTTHPPKGSELAEALAQATPGTILLLTRDLVSLFGRWRPQFTAVDAPIDVRVIQSGDGRRAIVVPLSGAGATALAGGRHRLRLERKRWETTDPVDELNTYAAEATLALNL